MAYNFIHLSTLFTAWTTSQGKNGKYSLVTLVDKSIFCAMGKCSEVTAHVLRRNCWVNSVHWKSGMDLRTMNGAREELREDSKVVQRPTSRPYIWILEKVTNPWCHWAERVQIPELWSHVMSVIVDRHFTLSQRKYILFYSILHFS